MTYRAQPRLKPINPLCHATSPRVWGVLHILQANYLRKMLETLINDLYHFSYTSPCEGRLAVTCPPSCANKILEAFTYTKYDLCIYNNGKVLKSYNIQIS